MSLMPADGVCQSRKRKAIRLPPRGKAVLAKISLAKLEPSVGMRSAPSDTNRLDPRHRSRGIAKLWVLISLTLCWKLMEDDGAKDVCAAF